jgi:type VI secretion system protein ImpM
MRLRLVAGGAVGIFGKLPTRRDYVQHGVEPRIMQVLDPWLQDALAESRRALGHAWLDHWLLSPIWRFWFGGRVAGRPVLGALMPSVDGVGRYFPLCLTGAYDPAPPPPETDDQPDWFAAVEDLLLCALDEEGTYDGLLAGLAALSPPRTAPAADGPSAPADLTDVQAIFAALRGDAPVDLYDRCTCWWVPSTDGTSPPRALLRRGLPAPAEYTFMVALDGDPGLAPASPVLGEAP